MRYVFVLWFCSLCNLQQLVSGVSLPPIIKIRGHGQAQILPATYSSRWKTWTCELSATKEEDVLLPVDNNDDEGWCNPSSFDTLFLPADLPMPMARMALGIVMANGSPRYLMPSLVLTLETPGKIWRNRGLNSLPRANAWIDMFAPFSVSIDALKLASFGQFAADVRFLEDSDGSSAWQALDGGPMRTILRPSESALYDIAPTYDFFQKKVLKSDSEYYNEIKTDYHFVDVPLLNIAPIRLPTSRRLRQFLTDFGESCILTIVPLFQYH